MESTARNTIQKVPLVNYLEKLVQIAENSKLDNALFEAAEEEIKQICRVLKCSEIQAVLFTAIFSQSIRKSEIDRDDICKFFDCNSVLIAKYNQDIEYLVNRGLVCKTFEKWGRYLKFSSPQIQYYISDDVFEFITLNKRLKRQKKTNLNLIEFFDHLNGLFMRTVNDDAPITSLTKGTIELLKSNNHLETVVRLKALNLEENNLLYFLYLGCKALIEFNHFDLSDTITDIFKSMNDRIQLKKEIVKGRNQLMTYKLLELDDINLRSGKIVKITERGLDILFGNEKESLIQEFNMNSKLFKNICEFSQNELFFDNDTERQINFIGEILNDKTMSEIKDRLAENKMNNAVTILFYGPPGTGKTETVYQLARITGREILQVEISETKSCWFGESEKLIKEVFTVYRRRAAKVEKTPILLFNEADAIFSKRKETAFSAVSQTENAIQNIILQEMETMEGILIATTNLTFNFDKAFERRFLFKVKFNAPDMKIRAKIWQSKLHFLNQSDIENLAKIYSFSGGQIENISRKCLIHYAINGKYPSGEQIEIFCEEEKINKTNSGIGYI